MAKIAFENGRISNSEGLVTLDRAILHTVVHHSLTFIYKPNFIEIEPFHGWTDVGTYICTYARIEEHLRLWLY